MVWLLCFIFAAPQETYYEYYDSGLRKLEAREYEDAIADLETAVELRPESSERARSYGVQLFAYLPYHRLAEACLMTKDFDRANDYLERAYAYGEHETKDEAVAAKMKMMQDILRSYDTDAEAPSETLTEPEAPDITPVLDLASRQKRYKDALVYLDLMLESNPDDPALNTLKTLTEEIVRTQETERKEREQAQARLDELRRQARASLAEGDLERALRLYATLDELEPGNRVTERAIASIEQGLEEIGTSRAEIEAQYEEATKLIDTQRQMLAAETAKTQTLSKRLLDLQDQLKRMARPAPKLARVVMEFVITNVSNQKLEAHIRANIEANVALREASLFINGEMIETWSLMNNWKYSIPPLLNYRFNRRDNTLELRVVDEDKRIHSDSITYQFQKEPPLISRRTKQILAAAFAAFVLLSFALYKMRQRRAFRERFNPYIAGAPVLNEQMFYGREGLMRQILNTLHNNSLMIYGERRIGKTSFLHRLNHALPLLEDPHYDFIPVIVDLQGVREADFFATLEHEIAAQLETRNIALDPPEIPMDARQFTSRLRKYINLLKEQGEKKPKLVLLLDEVDVMNNFSEHTNQQLRSVFMKGFAEHIVAVMAGIHINKQWTSEGSPWYNFFEQIELRPFPKGQADALVTQPVRGVYQYSRDAVELIMDLTGGKPYLIQKICLNLVMHILSENRRKIGVEDVKYVYEQIKSEFEGASS